MSKRFLLVLAAVLLQFPGLASAGVRIGIGLGFGIPIGPYPYYPYPYPYYGAYPYAAPVVVQQPAVVMPAPQVYQTAPAVVGTSPSYGTMQPVVAGSSPQIPPPPPMQSAPPPPPQAYNPPQSSGVVLSSYDHSAADALLQRVGQPDENVRRDAIMDLGRMKAERAVDTITSVLANDSSPVVRDAAARSLGLIGSTRALPALIRAAQADNDRDVRHSAQFAIEVIRSQLRR